MKIFKLPHVLLSCLLAAFIFVLLITNRYTFELDSSFIKLKATPEQQSATPKDRSSILKPPDSSEVTVSVPGTASS